jgi:hypothetical protein
MAVYYFVFIVSFLLCVLDYVKVEKIKIIAYTTFCLLLVLLPGFRSVGNDNDSTNYADIFDLSKTYTLREIVAGDYPENIERGFMLLNKVVASAGGSVTAIFLAIAVLSGVLNYLIIYKVSPYPFTALLFYLSFFYLYRDFTQIRYGLSCALCFWSVYFFVGKNYLLTVLTLLFAIFVHSAAFILVLVLPCCLLVKNKYLYLALPFVCVVGIVFNPFQYLLTLGGVPAHMQIYLDEEGGGGFIVSALGYLIMMIYIFYKKQLSNDNYNFALYYRLFAVGVALNLLFIQASIFQRFSNLLFQFSVLFLPNLLWALRDMKYRYYLVFLHFMFLCFFLYYGIKLISPALIRPYV